MFFVLARFQQHPSTSHFGEGRTIHSVLCNACSSRWY